MGAAAETPRGPLRVLIAKMGLDSHDHGVRVVARALVEAGFEVIYLGTHNRPEHVAQSAAEEEADVVGLSFLSGEHLSNCRRLLSLFKARGIAPLVIAGGVIPPADARKLRMMGVAEVFGPGTPADTVIRYLREQFGCGP